MMVKKLAGWIACTCGCDRAALSRKGKSYPVPRAISKRNHEQRVETARVRDYRAALEPRGFAVAHDLVDIAAGAEHAHLAVMHGPHHDIARLGAVDAVRGVEYLGRTDDVAIDMRLVHVHFAHRAHPVLEHAAVVAEPDADRPPELVLVTRDDLIDAILGEELRPALELVVIDGMHVLHHEPRDGIAHRSRHRHVPGLRSRVRSHAIKRIGTGILEADLRGPR